MSTPIGTPDPSLDGSPSYPFSFPILFGGTLGPSIFMSDYEFPPMGTTVVPPLPKSEGGLIQSVKGAIVMALRDALQKTTLFDPGQAVYIDLEYPMRQVQYPGIWVQFSTTKLNRSGIGHEVTVQDPDTGVWSFVQEWTFLGRVTLTIAALRSIDRDRLADALIANIAFARPPNLLLTQPQADTKQYRSLITALDENPYVSMTLNTDTIVPGGQTISMGTPWKDDELTYEDNYSFDLVGQFNLQFSHDGVYSLAAIEPNLSVMNGAQPYNPSLWLDAIPSGPVGGGLGNPGGTVINPNITIPAF